MPRTEVPPGAEPPATNEAGTPGTDEGTHEEWTPAVLGIEGPASLSEPSVPILVLSTAADRHVFAFEVETLATLAALGRRRKGYAQDFWHRKGEFLAAVLGSGAGVELRFTSRPDEAAFTRGRVAVQLIARVGGDAAKAEDLARAVHRLQRTTLPEYQLRPLASAAVAALLVPARRADAVEVRRRVLKVRLDTLRAGEAARPRVGFSARSEGATAVSEVEGAAIPHVFPFTPPQASLNRLFELLLTTPGCVSVSFRLEPAALSEAERSHLESQIALCESHAQTGLRGGSDDPTMTRPTLQAQARALERLLTRTLDRMRRGAALLRVHVYADRPLSVTVAHQVASLLSAPVSGGPLPGDSPTAPLVGGYEIVPCSAVVGLGWNVGDDLPETCDFPAETRRLPFLFSFEEAAGAFLLPPAPRCAGLGIGTRGSRELVPPQDMSEDGLLVGRARYQDAVQDFRVAEADRLQHVYVCGQTGTGKSTLLAGMILADISRGEGVCVIDPHGDLYQDVLQRVPESRAKDVVLIDPTDADWPVGVNLLEASDPLERHFAIDALAGVMERVLEDLYGPHAAKEYAGPAFWQQVRMNLSLLTHDPERPATLIDFCAMLQENGYWKRWTPLKTDDPQLHRWVDNTLTKMDFTRMTGDSGTSWGLYVGSKFESFIFFPPLRRIFGQQHSTIDFRKVMDEGKILLVNLAKGNLTDINARFLGMILLAKLQSAAMGRTDAPRESRRPFHLYVDEFGTMATRFFVSLLSEGRKFGISLVLANQFTGQIRDEAIRDAIFGNVGTIVSFRTGHDDAVRLTREFYPGPTPRDFVSLPNWRAYTRAVVRGQRVPAFVLETIPLGPVRDPQARERVLAHSRTAYGRPVPPPAPTPSTTSPAGGAREGGEAPAADSGRFARLDAQLAGYVGLTPAERANTLATAKASGYLPSGRLVGCLCGETDDVLGLWILQLLEKADPPLSVESWLELLENAQRTGRRGLTLPLSRTIGRLKTAGGRGIRAIR